MRDCLRSRRGRSLSAIDPDPSCGCARDTLRSLPRSAVERGGVPPRLRARRLAVRDGPTRYHRRRGVPRVPRKRRGDVLRGSGPSPGAGIRQGRATCTSWTRWPARARCTAFDPIVPRSRTACCRAVRCSAWPSTRSAGSSSRRATPSIGSTSGCGAFSDPGRTVADAGVIVIRGIPRGELRPGRPHDRKPLVR